MKKSFSIMFLLSLFTNVAFCQSTWIPEGDYRLYSAEYSWLALKGVSYSVVSNDSNETRYKNYIQFSDFHTGLMPPGYYTMMDTVGPFGDHSYYPQSDQVKLFKMGLLLPNHPTAQQVYLCYSDNVENLRIDAVSGNWSYSSEYNDSILSFTLLVYTFNGQPNTQHPIHSKTLSYGKNSGLISYPFDLNLQSGVAPPSRLLYSEQLQIGSLPKKPEDVFNYEAGNEFHSIRTEWSYRQVDSSFIIRKTLAVNKNGNLIERIDSVHQATYQYHYDSTNTWRLFGLTYKSKHIDTTLTDLSMFAFFGTNKTQTAVFPFDSMHNQEYFMVENNSAISPVKLVVGRELPYANLFTPAPPFAYRSQIDPLFVDTEYSVYYPMAGGPYLKTSMGSQGEEEILVYVKDVSGERGVPLDPSLVSSLKKPGTAEIRLYPNPATKTVHLQLSESGNWQAILYTVQGQEIGAFSFEGDSHTLDLSGFQSGIYFIRLTNGAYSGSARLVVEGGN